MTTVSLSAAPRAHGHRALLTLLAAVLVVVTALAGCGTGTDPDPDMKPVEHLADISGEWSLESEPSIWFTVDESGAVNGSRGCTEFSSSVSVEDSELRFGEFWSDGVQCGEPFDDAWDQLTTSLRDPVSARVGEGRLALDSDLMLISKVG